MIFKCQNIRRAQRIVYNYICLIDYLVKNNYEIDEECNEVLGILSTLLIIEMDTDDTWITDEGKFKNILPNENIGMYLNKSKYQIPNIGINEKRFFNTVNYEWYCNNNVLDEENTWKNVEDNYRKIFDNLCFHKSYKKDVFWNTITFKNVEEVLNDKNCIVLWDDIMYFYKVKEELRDKIKKIIKEDRVVCIYKNELNPWTKEQKELWYNPDNILAVLSKYDLINVIKNDDIIKRDIYRILKRGNENFADYIYSYDASDAYKELFRNVNMNELENNYSKKEFEDNFFRDIKIE